MRPTELLNTARDLAEAGRGKPRHTNLRRACSTAYYALFHAVCQNCADTLIGRRGTRRAWTQVYRQLEHGFAKSCCLAIKSGKLSFTDEIENLANLFVQMQEKRHRADYDPNYRTHKSEVLVDIAAIEATLSDFAAVPKRHRKAFAAFVLMKSRTT